MFFLPRTISAVHLAFGFEWSNRANITCFQVGCKLYAGHQHRYNLYRISTPTVGSSRYCVSFFVVPCWICWRLSHMDNLSLKLHLLWGKHWPAHNSIIACLDQPRASIRVDPTFLSMYYENEQLIEAGLPRWVLQTTHDMYLIAWHTIGVAGTVTLPISTVWNYI